MNAIVHSFTPLDPVDDFINAAEALIGHSLDGVFHRDGYSIDNAMSYFRRGFTVENYVTLVTGNSVYRRRHARAFAVRCLRSSKRYKAGQVYLAVPWPHPYEPWREGLLLNVGRGRFHAFADQFEPVRACNRGHFPRMIATAAASVPEAAR